MAVCSPELRQISSLYTRKLLVCNVTELHAPPSSGHWSTVVLKCAQCMQCNLPLPALGNEQDHKVAAVHGWSADGKGPQ